jgi:hypothetical protein
MWLPEEQGKRHAVVRRANGMVCTRRHEHLADTQRLLPASICLPITVPAALLAACKRARSTPAWNGASWHEQAGGLMIGAAVGRSGRLASSQ